MQVRACEISRGLRQRQRQRQLRRDGKLRADERQRSSRRFVQHRQRGFG
jgi:hypothetical protein